MKPKLKVYVAGPDVFAPNQKDIFETRKNILITLDFIPLCPMDNEITWGPDITRNSRMVFDGNVKMIIDADIVLANCNDFRGQCIDDGTAFEIGYASSFAAKMIIGYRNSVVPMKDRYGDKDYAGWNNEDFGDPINLMMMNAIRRSGGIMVCGGFIDAVNKLCVVRDRILSKIA